VTSALNIVNPGGQRRPRIVTHLGFMPLETAADYPRSTCTGCPPLLTQRGAVAHCDMPVQTGPTM
jgi:hypothetical protein